MKTICNIIYTTGLLLLSLVSNAQIGIMEPTNDPKALLEIEATDKGVLIPRMQTTERFALLSDCQSLSSCPNGLLVYDTDKEAFFYLQDEKWFVVSTWKTPDTNTANAENSNTDLVLVKDVGIGKAPAATYKLDVNGNTNINGTATVSSGNLEINNGNLTANTGNLTANNGSITVNGNVTTNTGVFTANGYSSNPSVSNVNGPVPRGGIIMWTGSSVPSGWALCDGSNGTPDLRGRFVVASGSRSELYSNPDGSDITTSGSASFSTGSSGGADYVMLSVSQIGAHRHTGSTNSLSHSHSVQGGDSYRRDNDGGGRDWIDEKNVTSNETSGYSSWGGNHRHSFTVPDEGDGDGHYNIPKYYVLAFIMKK